jgi:hypothetical protein
MRCVAESDLGLCIVKDLVGDPIVAGVIEPVLECRNSTLCEKGLRCILDDLQDQFLRVMLLSYSKGLVPCVSL